MPEANSTLIISNPPSPHPRFAPTPVHKPILLGHSDIKMVYTHVLNRGPAVVRSPGGGTRPPRL
jgi:hypothetical protein